MWCTNAIVESVICPEMYSSMMYTIIVDEDANSN